MTHPKPGPAEEYVRAFTLARQRRPVQGWTPMEQALVLTLIDWKVECEMRPTSGPGSDCSDLMDTALARITGLAKGDLTPAQVIDSIEPTGGAGHGEDTVVVLHGDPTDDDSEQPCRMCLRDDCRGGCF